MTNEVIFRGCESERESCCGAEEEEEEESKRAGARASRDTRAELNMKELTPRSISPIPPSSALQNRRGKAVKSTARIAMQVSVIMMLRYNVIASVQGRRSGRRNTMHAHNPAATRVMGTSVTGIMTASTRAAHCSAASCNSTLITSSKQRCYGAYADQQQQQPRACKARARVQNSLCCHVRTTREGGIRKHRRPPA